MDWNNEEYIIALAIKHHRMLLSEQDNTKAIIEQELLNITEKLTDLNSLKFEKIYWRKTVSLISS
ncbi:hypothetical protein AN392_01219 [Pseudoalteromonas sp. P1-16-1b]|uniref:hypothetical protein n=1 Tax=Pseudoalteromonas sp. P1-16-1b TaxID=1723757 RepID=UPI0006D681B6|nr:hypothetical protein [Pseudoalteromonas sp. P1-16-1b]KPZ65671.1 hypothetical protein AN392_01219 [Pseudoalteromonas sp. P1-16-1b]